MYIRKNLASLMSIALFLGGCDTTPRMVDTYNAKTNARICKMSAIPIKSNPGFSSIRTVFLTLEKIGPREIRGIISASNLYDSSPFNPPAIIHFNLINDQNVGTSLTFKESGPAHYESVQFHNSGGIYGGVYPVKITEPAVVFDLTTDHLNQIIESPSVTFRLAAGEVFIEDEISSFAKEAFQSFRGQCFD